MREEFRVHSLEYGALSKRFKSFDTEAQAIQHIKEKKVGDLLCDSTFTIVKVWTTAAKQA